jgi:hypothetical protein
MKKSLLTLLLLAGASASNAQTEQFKKGQIDAQVGLGFVNTMTTKLYDGSTDLNLSTFKSPPILATVDFGVTDEFSAGGYVNYFHTEYLAYMQRETSKTFVIGVRGLYHVDLLPVLDTYGGVGLGYGASSRFAHGYFFSDPDVSYTKGELYYQLTVGARYRFAEKVGAFVELGYGVALINLGINLKF